MHSQELRANREQHNGYYPGCNTLILIHTTSFHIRMQTSSEENLWEERGRRDEGLSVNRWIWFTNETSQAQVQCTDSATLGVNFKELSQANQFSSTADLPLSFVPSLQLPSYPEQESPILVNEGSNPRDRSELVQTTVVCSWEIWLDLDNWAKECLGVFSHILYTYLCCSCAAAPPRYNFTGAQQTLPQNLQQAPLAKKCKITLKEGKAGFLVSVSSYILLSVLPPNICPVKNSDFWISDSRILV